MGKLGHITQWAAIIIMAVILIVILTIIGWQGIIMIAVGAVAIWATNGFIIKSEDKWFKKWLKK